MISLYSRVYVLPLQQFGRITERIPITGGTMFNVLIETSDGSHVERLFGSRDLRVAIVQASGVTPLPVRSGLRLVVDNTVRA